MKKKPQDSYLFPILFGVILLVPLIVLTMAELGYIGMDEATSVLDKGYNIMYIVAGIIAAIIFVGALIKAFRLMKREDGRGYAQKLVIILIALIGIFLRFNNAFDWF